MNIIKTQLYEGTVELTFQPYGHKYSVNGKPVKSVTQVLKIIDKPKLVNWAARMAVETVKEEIQANQSYDEVQLMSIFEKAQKAHYQNKIDAGNVGTFVHNWVEDYISSKHPVLPKNEQLQKSIQKFLDWEKEYKVRFLLSEQQVYSKKYNYTGTLDFICEIEGKLYIGDLKTSSGIYPEMLIQTAAYRFARTEEFPEEKYVGQIIVRVGKTDGEVEIATVKNDQWYAQFFTAFIAALKLSESMERIDQFVSEKL